MKDKKDIEKMKKVVKMVNREDLICETNKYIYNFHYFETIISFAKNIFV